MPSRRNDPKEWNPELLVDQSTERIKGRLTHPWRYICSNASSYSAEIFSHVALELILHPERNSKNIRRADILQDTDLDLDTLSESGVAGQVGLHGMTTIRTIRRRLMPRNPNLDPSLEQTCRFYASEQDSSATLVTYRCHYIDNKVPYYVPDVLGIAFELYQGKVYIAYLPLEGQDCNSDRLARVALNLLRTFHRHWYSYPLTVPTLPTDMAV